MITELSQHDVDLFPTIVEDWINVGISTTRSKRSIVEQNALKLYENAGMSPPKEFHWFNSPFECINFIKTKDPKSTFKNISNEAMYGNHDASWLAFYEFFTKCDSVKIDSIDLIVPHINIARECNWWWAYDKMCVFSEKPIELFRDLEGRLHHDEKMSVKYADGWGLYCWHGYTIPEEKTWIISEKSKLNADAIDAEPNVELRRVMLEIYGFDRYIDERGAELVSEDTDGAGNPRKLYSMKVGNETVKVLQVTNSSLEPDGSRRKFHIGVVNGENPHEAVAHSFGFNPEYFKESVCT